MRGRRFINFLGPLGGAGNGPAPVLWTPANDPNAVAWWDAQDTPHIGLSGSNVTSWADRIGSTTPGQATGASQPTWSATARNGKAGLNFNGLQSLVLNASFGTVPAVNTAVSIIVAGYASATPATWADIFCYGANAQGSLRQVAMFSSNVIAASSTDAGINYTTAESWLNTDRFFFSEWSVANAITGFVDGGTAEAGGTNSPAAAGGNLVIGAEVNGSSQPWEGVVQQIVVRNTDTASASLLQKYAGWESWWDGKAGTNLPSSNPYSSTGSLHRAPYVSDP